MKAATPASVTPITTAGQLAGHVIFLNKCPGGCMVVPGDDDATTVPPHSNIVSSPRTLSEYTAFQAGEWEAIVQCVKEIYSPFNVQITDVRPPDGTPFSMIMVGGSGAEVGADGAGGIASFPPGGVGALERGTSFAFTDEIDIFAGEDGGNRVNGMCWIIGQETAHNFALGHEFAFLDDNSSACNDPMTYRDECGGQKFFRNRQANCGEFGPPQDVSPHACPNGGASQNSHLALLGTFGEGTSIVPAPNVAITTPAMSSTAPNSFPANIIASAGSDRGVDKVELYLNGFLFTTVKGAPFGRMGQLNPAPYGLMPPNNLPDSIYDIKAIAYDDLGVKNESPVITVIKGANAAGCADATSCLAGQKCEMGRCFWDPPSGNVGDDCSFPQFCLSGLCSNSVVQTKDAICTQHCIPGVADSCPMGFECDMAAAICLAPQTSGGCCSSSSSTPWAPFGFASVVLGFVFIRRRRR